MLKVQSVKLSLSALHSRLFRNSGLLAETTRGHLSHVQQSDLCGHRQRGFIMHLSCLTFCVFLSGILSCLFRFSPLLLQYTACQSPLIYLSNYLSSLHMCVHSLIHAICLSTYLLPCLLICLPACLNYYLPTYILTYLPTNLHTYLYTHRLHIYLNTYQHT